MNCFTINKRKTISLLLLLIGAALITSGQISITGAAVGISSSISLTPTVLGFLSIFISFILFLSHSDESELEWKLKKTEDVKLRRELLSEAVRAKEFAKRGCDINGCWDSRKSYKENVNKFLETFYGEASREIADSYRIYVRDILKQRFKEEYLKSDEFEKFRKKAIRLIIEWNGLVLSGEFAPLHVRSEKQAKAYPDKMSSIVYYGPRYLKGKSREFYNNARKTGSIIAAHEIVNPEAVNNPSELRECPHIHWELENVMREGYKFK